MAAVADLPHIDEHAVEVAASPERVWEALGAVLSRTFAGKDRIGRLLGTRPSGSTGDPLEEARRCRASASPRRGPANSSRWSASTGSPATR